MEKTETDKQEQTSQPTQEQIGQEQISEKKEHQEEEMVCTPYEFSNKSGKEVDYNKLIAQFGTRPLTKEMLEEFEKVTKEKPHILMRRGSSELT